MVFFQQLVRAQNSPWISLRPLTSLYVFVRKMKKLASCDCYILNLAIIDIIMPLIGFPLPIYSSLHHELAIGEYLCSAYGFTGFFCGVVSISTLAAISVARYVQVCRTDQAQKLVKNTKYCIIVIYCYGAIWACLPLSGIRGYGPEPYGTSCTLQWEGNDIFVSFFLIFCVIIPVIIMNVSYGRILVHLRRSRRKTSRTIINAFSRCSVRKRARETYLMKMTFTMCVVFILLWSPYAVVSLWTAYGRKDVVPVRVTLISVLIAKLSTIINPIVYFVLNKKFRPFLPQYTSFKRKITSSST
ncbi:opsin-5-like [Mytilus edulis]|uniref:opsin-5-like n=1 Tax=Mytilus edulis TaxID=6550 RepID=UPI0039F07786